MMLVERKLGKGSGCGKESWSLLDRVVLLCWTPVSPRSESPNQTRDEATLPSASTPSPHPSLNYQ
jgi:hypothetical protein